MKSRTSFFNPTVYKKNLTRFAPVWIAYCILLLLYLSNVIGMRTVYVRALNVADMIPYMAFPNLCYAFALVQVLFGDMYNTRLCNALHALPMKRECWYVTNLASALTFSLVPNLLVALIALSIMGSGWMLAVYWFAASAMQFVFFLGTALVSAMLVGNRFAMVPVYVLINLLSILAYWFAAKIYQPLLYGVRITSSIFELLCPMSQMMSFHQIVGVREMAVLNSGEVVAWEKAAELVSQNGPTVFFSTSEELVNIVTGAGWGYHAICALIGVALIFVGLWLYRKRALETAGDFIAYSAVKPVVLILFTLGMGGVFQLCADIFGLEMQYVFLAAGLVVGYYAGRMLLMRTTRVFQPKAVLGIVSIGAVLVASLVLVKVDAFCIIRRVPNANQIETVEFTDVYSFNFPGNTLEVTDAEGIETLREIHQDLIDNREDSSIYTSSFLVRYTLTDGSTLERYYDNVTADSRAGQLLEGYYSSFEHILELEEGDIPTIADNLTHISFDNGDYNRESYPEFFENHDIEGLFRAIAADCAAGHMAQDTAFHLGEYRATYIGFGAYQIKDINWYGDVFVYESCENTLRWLDENGISYNTEGKIGG